MATRQSVAQMAADSEAAHFAHRAPQPLEARGGAGRIQISPQNKARYYP